MSASSFSDDEKHDFEQYQRFKRQQYLAQTPAAALSAQSVAQLSRDEQTLKPVWEFIIGSKEEDKKAHPFKPPGQISPEEKKFLDQTLEKQLYTLLSKYRKHYMVDFVAVLALLYTSAFGLGYFASQWGFTGNGWPTLYTVVMGVLFIVAISILWTGSFGNLPPKDDRDSTLRWVKGFMILSTLYFVGAGFAYAFAYYGINGGNYDNLSADDCETVNGRIDFANSFMKYGLIAVAAIHVPLLWSLRSSTTDVWIDRYNFAEAQKDVNIKKAFTVLSGAYNLEESIKDIVEANNEDQWLPK